ncbi:MAG: hypothetical protein LUG99_10860 [Lachnospiraceae bacterium]|nr:hypothetical protein [Lachnospiraceae bacterium]
MNRENVNNWINGFVNAWKEHDVDAVLDIFDCVEEYYEGPFSEPVSTRKEVETLWIDIKYQDISNLVVDLIALEKDTSAMHWYLKYRDIRDDVFYEMDGTYEVKFAENGKCRYFKQWWVINE